MINEEKVYFKPENRTTNVDPFTTPNKNITSTFDKSDTCCFIQSCEKFPVYSFNPIVLVVHPDKITFPENYFVELDLLSKIIKSERKDGSFIYSDNLSEDKSQDFQTFFGSNSIEIEHQDNFIGVQSHNLRNKFLKTLKELNLCSKNLFVQIIFYDWMNRNQIVEFTNFMLKMAGFRGVMVMPLSLVYLIARNALSSTTSKLSTSAVLRFDENICSFIDDYTPIDTYVYHSSPFYSKWSEPTKFEHQEISEEFTKLKTFHPENKFICKACNHAESTNDKIQNHLLNSKRCNTGFYEYLHDIKCNKKSKRFDALGLKEKVGEDEIEINLENKRCLDLCVIGAGILRELEASKEFWLTDIEWKKGGIRLLKEKILFYL